MLTPSMLHTVTTNTLTANTLTTNPLTTSTSAMALLASQSEHPFTLADGCYGLATVGI